MLDPSEFPAGSVLGPYRSTGDWFEPGVLRDGDLMVIGEDPLEVTQT
jgi:hypothetical protein